MRLYFVEVAVSISLHYKATPRWTKWWPLGGFVCKFYGFAFTLSVTSLNPEKYSSHKMHIVDFIIYLYSYIWYLVYTNSMLCIHIMIQTGSFPQVLIKSLITS